MKKLILSLLLVLAAVPAIALEKEKTNKQIEALEYNVYYHWGILWKKAGYGIFSLEEQTLNNGETRYHGKLAGKSLSIIEFIMRVRDTLECWYKPDVVPIQYRKGTHEGKYTAEEVNRYTTFYQAGKPHTAGNVDSTQVFVTRWRSKKGKDTTYDEVSHSVDEVGYDMLSVFYKIRSLDFSKMRKGQEVKLPVFSGLHKADYMSVEFKGNTTCKLRNGKTYPAYALDLTFKSKDSDQTPVQIWVSTDPDHRPLICTIQLRRVGEIQGQWIEPGTAEAKDKEEDID
jgi:hypothetical protein